VTALLVAWCVLLGLIVGSFLNVVAHRVPRGESVVRPRSRCPGCGAEIAARDNIPVLSWLLLRGRCRHCHEPISRRYPLVEAATGALFAAMALRFGLDAALPAFLYLAAISVVLTVIDLDVHRLPNAIVLPSYPVAALLLGLAALEHGRQPLQSALLGAAGLYAVYFLLALAYPAGMGFGDVKLAGVLGAYLGWLGWEAWMIGLVGGFLLGGVTGIALLATGRAGRKTKIAYGPFLLLGALLAVFAGDPIADAWLRV
jgi:leader peptidase (prepilin peptidase) / N-methyltransferase